jgi:putative ABC transport system permease protein
MERGRRLYRILLRLYPAEFRDEYGREMAQVLRDRIERESPLRVWLDVIRDLLVTAPRERAQVLLTDFRYAIRLVRKSPAFAAAVISTVALTIAANTAIFSVVNAVLLSPLPFAEPNRLVQVAEKNDKLNLSAFGASVLNFMSWRERTHSFSELSAIGFASFTLTGMGEPEQIGGNRVSPALMHTLGLTPVAGRGFVAEEEKPGGPAVAMMSEGLWTRRFGRDPAAVGRVLTLNGGPVTIVGVAPAAMNLIASGDIYTPLTLDPAKEIRLNHVIFVAGRLRPGATLQQAQTECDEVAADMAKVYPEIRDWAIHLVPFFDTFVSPQLETGLVVLLFAVGFVLVIACANIANLLLARATSRQKEMALRTVLGATRRRVLHQLLVESVTLSAIGGVVGILGALFAVPAMSASLPANLLPVPDVRVDRVVLLFGVGLTLATGLIFGIVPAWYASRSDVADTLKRTSPGAGGSRGRLRSGLAAAELALATMLLIGAGLLVQSFLNLQRVRLGFEPNGLLTFQLAPPTSRYSLGDKAPLFYHTMLGTVSALPGVRSAAVSSGVPFGQGNYTTSPVAAVGSSARSPDTAVPIDWRIVSPGYFRTMGIPLLRGRDLDDVDRTTAAPVIVVSQATAKTFWGDADPLGRSLRRIADGSLLTVVGVVGDVRNTTLSRESPTLYYPMAAHVWPVMDVAIRTDLPPQTLLPMLRQKIHEIDRDLPLSTVRTMNEWISTSAVQPRLNAIMLGLFAVVAVVIAVIGIYGVLAYSVSQRRREIAVRLALGARPERVMRLVVGEGMNVAIAGIGIGLLGGVLLNRTLRSLVYAVAPRDPATFVVVAVILSTVALAACLLPARRAARVDPIVALREE